MSRIASVPLTRRSLLHGALATGAIGVQERLAAIVPTIKSSAADSAVPMHQRPAKEDRRFVSPAVEKAILHVKDKIVDQELAQIFENCLPNTLDTTVFPGTYEGKPDTFVITGDINAMWLRDSSAQVWPYLEFCKEDARLASLIEGVIRRHTRCIALDPYANAFLRTSSDRPLSWSIHDDTDMRAGVGERKWEVDSLCHTIRLAYGYWKATGNAAPFDKEWLQSAWKIVQTLREQQRKIGPGPYHFQRSSPIPSESLMLGGYGNPARPVGLIYSGFRPSDDACMYPLFIPANFFAATSMQQLAEIAAKVCKDDKLANEAIALKEEVLTSLMRNGQIDTKVYGRIWAYEVDGYGNMLCIDDANAPGLLSLSYLGCTAITDPIFQRTRSFALSSSNPYFFSGTAGEGIGSPHTGLDYIWPMSVLFRAFSSKSDTETLQCLKTLRNSTGSTHFMHESFHKDDPTKYTRSWFAWANTLFGELIFKTFVDRPDILQHHFS